MAELTINAPLILRNDSTVNWQTYQSKVLLKGEPALEFLDTGKVKLKIGDGVTAWQNLDYFGGLDVLTGAAAPSSSTAGELGQFYYDSTSKKLWVYLDSTAENPWKNLATAEDVAAISAQLPNFMKTADYAVNGIAGTVDAAQKVVDSTTGRENAKLLVDDNKTGADAATNNGLWTANKIKTISDELSTSIGNKVDKVSGKQLSTEDYTTAEKNKLRDLLPVNDSDTSANSTWSAEKILSEITASHTEVTLFAATKDSLETADDDVITTYFETNPTPEPKQGDIFIINTVVEEVEYEKSAYMYAEEAWTALTGMVDAEKVIFRKNITMAGDYTGVGNLTKSKNGTATFSVKGKSVAAAFEEMLSKRLQPGNPVQPSVSGFALTGAKAVEAGTPLPQAQFGTAKLSAGSYTYGPPTGIVATGYSVDRVATPSSFNQTGIVAAASGTDDNNGAGFIIGDETSVASNVVSSLAYKVTVTHGEGAIANDNLGSPSNPQIKISAGSKTQQTSAYTPFRKFFYGATATKPTLDSAYIRGLTNSTGAYSARTLTLQVSAGATRVAIACIGTATGVTKVINETALNADVTDTFTKSTVSVEGANGYAAKNYNVWVFEPAVPYENAATLKVTLG